MRVLGGPAEGSKMKVTLFLGGARSGKSRLAQIAAEAHQGPLAYLATGEARDAEMAERIALHRAGRGPRWRTIECPLALPAAIDALSDGAGLVDCLTLWLSNLLLEGHDLAAARTDLLRAMRAVRVPLFVVSNEVGFGIVPATPVGRAFRDEAGRLNQSIAAAADEVLFVVAGLIMPLKGRNTSNPTVQPG